jgi:hypothetical protein
VPKKRRARKPASRSTRRPRRAAAREPDLLDDVARALDSPEPLDLLALTSTLLAATEPRRPGLLDEADHRDTPLAQFVETLLAVDRRETTALLLVLAALRGDELLRRRVGEQVRRRAQELPEWIDGLVAARPADPAWQLSHVLGDGENILLGVLLPGGKEFTLVAYVDHNLGTLVKDAFAVPGPARALAEQMRTVGDDPDTSVTEVDPADARARLTEAMLLTSLTVPPIESDTWPACRPLVQWALGMLPEGGTGYLRPEWDEPDLAALTDRFVASEAGLGLDDEDGRSLLESLLWFGTDYGPGDPMRWSPVAVEIVLLDWFPRKVVADAEHLSRLPSLLRAFVSFCHAERGIRAELTAQTLRAVDECEPEYQRIIRSPRPQGPEALIARLREAEQEGW